LLALSFCSLSLSSFSKTQIYLRIANQLEHLRSQLEDLTNNDPVDWIIAVGHYPIYSAGDHCDNSELISYLKPLLVQYNVPIFISGHDHISEHLQYEGIHYFVASAGSMTDNLKSSCTTKASLTWYGVGYSAFAYADVTTSSLTINYIDVNNELKYSYLIPRPQSSRRSKAPTSYPTYRPKPSIIPTESPSLKPTRRRDFSSPSPTIIPSTVMLFPPQAVSRGGGNRHRNSFSSSSSSATSNTSKLVCLSLGSVAVLGLIGFFFFRSFRRRKNNANDAENQNGGKKRTVTKASVLASVKSPGGNQQRKRINKNYLKFVKKSPARYRSADHQERMSDEDEEDGGFSDDAGDNDRGLVGNSLYRNSNAYEMVELGEGRRVRKQRKGRNSNHTRGATVDLGAGNNDRRSGYSRVNNTSDNHGNTSENENNVGVDEEELTQDDGFRDYSGQLPRATFVNTGSDTKKETSGEGNHPIYTNVHSPGGNQIVVHRRANTTAI
jgi:hypothetical protein